MRNDQSPEVFDGKEASLFLGVILIFASLYFLFKAFDNKKLKQKGYRISFQLFMFLVFLSLGIYLLVTELKVVHY